MKVNQFLVHWRRQMTSSTAPAEATALFALTSQSTNDSFLLAVLESQNRPDMVTRCGSCGHPCGNACVQCVNSFGEQTVRHCMYKMLWECQWSALHTASRWRCYSLVTLRRLVVLSVYVKHRTEIGVELAELDDCNPSSNAA